MRALNKRLFLFLLLLPLFSAFVLADPYATDLVECFKFDTAYFNTDTNASLGALGQFNLSVAGSSPELNVSADTPSGEAINFLGTGSYSITGLNTRFNSSFASLNVWIKKDTYDQNDGFMYLGSLSATNHYPFNSGGSPYNTAYLGYFRNDRPEVTGLYSGVEYTNWHMLTIVRNQSDGGSGYKVYLNGSLVDSYAIGTWGMSSPGYIGAAAAAGATPYNGQLDELCFWNRSIGASEVTELWDSGAGLFYTPSVGSVTWDIYSPLNDTGINANPINFTFNSTSGDSGYNCTLYEGGVNVASGTYDDGINSILLTSSAANYTNYVLSCLLSGTWTNSSTKTLYLDFDNPLITWTTPDNASTISHLLAFNVSISDANLYSGRIAISTDNGTLIYSENNSNITGTSKTYNGVLNVSSWGSPSYFSIFVEAKDGHTTLALKEDWTDTKISDGLRFNVGPAWYEITLVSGETALTTTDKLVDRYSFDFLVNTIKTGFNTYTFLVRSNYDLVPVPGSKYQAHLIDPVNNVWLDAEGKHQVTALRQLSPRSYEIDILTDKPDISFNSIGELNVVNDTRVVFECSPSYYCSGTTCYMNDTSLCSEVTLNNTCYIPYSGDYSEFGDAACNYCSPEITPVYSACTYQTQTLSYTDLNYSSCCLVTNLSADCAVNSTPYNESIEYECRATKSMTCQYSPYPNIKLLPDKIRWVCAIADNVNDYACLSYVYDFRGHLWQINPDRELIDQVGQIDSFQSNNGLVSVYFEPDLVPNQNYTFYVECNSGNYSAGFNASVTPVIEDISGKTVQGGLWLSSNFWWIVAASVLIGGLFLALFIGINYIRWVNGG